MLNRKLLRIYLQDHLAGSVAGLELAKRARNANEGTELGAFLDRLVADIEEDKRTLAKIMKRLGVPESSTKRGLAIVAERLGRLKLNGQLTGYSPLSRLVELEALRVGIDGKLALWRALAHAADLAAELPDVDFNALIERAERQRAGVEEHRLEAARLALGTARRETSAA